MKARLLISLAFAFGPTLAHSAPDASAPRDRREQCAARLFEQGTYQRGRVLTRRGFLLAGGAALVAGIRYGGPPLHRALFPPRKIHFTPVHGNDRDSFLRWADKGARIGLPTIPAGKELEAKERLRLDAYLGPDAAAKLRTDADIRGFFTAEEGNVLALAQAVIDLERDPEMAGFFTDWVLYAGSAGEIFPGAWGKPELFAAFKENQLKAMANVPESLRSTVLNMVESGAIVVTPRPSRPEDKEKVSYSYRNVRLTYGALLQGWWESRRETASSWDKRYIPPLLEALKQAPVRQSADLAMAFQRVIEDALKLRTAEFVAAAFADGRDVYLVTAPEYGDAVEKELRARFPEAMAAHAK